MNPTDEDSTEAYYKSIKDEDGFCIENGILYAYIGNDKEITIPENVEEIYPSALSGDFEQDIPYGNAELIYY